MLKQQRFGRSIDLSTLSGGNEVFSDTSIIYGDGSDKEIKNTATINSNFTTDQTSVLELSTIEENSASASAFGVQVRSPTSQILY